jgi:hypothetical protein
MPRSLHAMMSAGHISRGAYNAILRKTRAQPTKMAAFDDQSKSDGDRERAGIIGKNSINEYQKNPLPTRGGQARGGHAPDVDHINQRPLQKRKTPGDKMHKGKKGAPTATKGTIVQSGPMYGGPSSRKYG